MKYNIGDVIKIKCYMSDSATIYESKIAVITEICKPTVLLMGPFHYEVIVAGIEARKYFVNEDDIEEKL